MTTLLAALPTRLILQDKFPGVGVPGQGMLENFKSLGRSPNCPVERATQFIHPPAELQSLALGLGSLTCFSGYDFLFFLSPLSFLLFIYSLVCLSFNWGFLWTYGWHTRLLSFRCTNDIVIPRVCTLWPAHRKCSSHLSPHNTVTHCYCQWLHPLGCLFHPWDLHGCGFLLSTPYRSPPGLCGGSQTIQNKKQASSKQTCKEVDV